MVIRAGIGQLVKSLDLHFSQGFLLSAGLLTVPIAALLLRAVLTHLTEVWYRSDGYSMVTMVTAQNFNPNPQYLVPQFIPERPIFKDLN